MRWDKCKNGHELTPENTRIKPSPSGGHWRVCRTCVRIQGQKIRARKEPKESPVRRRRPGELLLKDRLAIEQAIAFTGTVDGAVKKTGFHPEIVYRVYRLMRDGHELAGPVANSRRAA